MERGMVTAKFIETRAGGRESGNLPHPLLFLSAVSKVRKRQRGRERGRFKNRPARTTGYSS
jgi:hypothetical protein